MVEFFKEIGLIKNVNIMVINYFKIKMYIKANIIMGKWMVMEFINGQVDKFIMGNLEMAINKGKVFGEDYKINNIMERGKIINQTDMESLNIKIMINIKVNLKIVWKMEKDIKFFRIMITLKDNIQMGNLTDLENIRNLMEVDIKDILKMGINKAMENGLKT